MSWNKDKYLDIINKTETIKETIKEVKKNVNNFAEEHQSRANARKAQTTR